MELSASEVRLLAHAAFSDVADQLTNPGVNARRVQETLARANELLEVFQQKSEAEAQSRQDRLLKQGIGSGLNSNWNVLS